jgi:anthranilate synthase component 2
VDNYDSFTFNLVQYLGELGAEVEVFRNDAIDVAGIRARRPAALVLSPGPCTPDDAGVTLEAVRALAGELPILGVCLGHQAIGQAFGGKVVRNSRIVHGKAAGVAGAPASSRACRCRRPARHCSWSSKRPACGARITA